MLKILSEKIYYTYVRMGMPAGGSAENFYKRGLDKWGIITGAKSLRQGLSTCFGCFYESGVCVSPLPWASTCYKLILITGCCIISHIIDFCSDGEYNSLIRLA